MRAPRRAGGTAQRAALAALLASGILGAGPPADAGAAVAHVVAPGETLWAISVANNLTTRTVAVFNGLPEDAQLVAGDTIQVPTVAEGAAALASVPASSTTSSSSTGGGGTAHVVARGESLWSVASANGLDVHTLASYNGLADDALLISGETIQVPLAASSSTTTSSGIALGTIWSPSGYVNLRADAAASWNAMRQASLDQLGIDIYPAGPLSAYRTYDQQDYLYNLYLSGQGAPANPPGTSSHELGIAVDVATESMRDAVDQIGGAYGWSATIPTEWWHVAYGG